MIPHRDNGGVPRKAGKLEPMTPHGGYTNDLL